MAEAYLYDHLRTPRGKGRPDGGLHTVSPVDMLAQVLINLRDRNELDTSLVEDVIAGCGSPIGEQGSAIGRSACLAADYASTTPGNKSIVIVLPGWKRLTSRPQRSCPNNADWLLLVASRACREYRSALPEAPGRPTRHWRTRFTLFPQGISADLIATLHGHSREDVDAYAAESQRRAATAWENGYFDRSVITVVDEIGMPLLRKDEAIRPGTTLESLGKLPAVFTRLGEMGSTNRPS